MAVMEDGAPPPPGCWMFPHSQLFSSKTQKLKCNHYILHFITFFCFISSNYPEMNPAKTSRHGKTKSGFISRTNVIIITTD
jgi:hypothetical protein